MITKNEVEIIREILLSKKSYIDECLKYAKFKNIDQIISILTSTLNIKNLTQAQGVALEILLSMIGGNDYDPKHFR